MNVSRLLDTRNGALNKKNNIFEDCFFLVWKGLSNDDVGVARGTVILEIRPGADFYNQRFR